MNSSRIAVVLPTFNRLGMLKRTLRSLELQEFRDFIVYVSDDASTDGTRFLGSSDFPNLNVQVVRRMKSFPTLMDHFSYLFYSAKEPIIAMAHDDEVYHPAWLARIVECFDDESVVFAYGQTVSVDAKTPQKKFFINDDKLSEGLFSGMELRKYAILQKLDLPANGFAIRASTLAEVTPFVSTYEQFDYEWMIRLADKGKTRIIPDLTTSYTVHASNTVGSRKYLQRLLNQKSSPQMFEEWLAETPDFTPQERAELAERLARGRANLNWTMFLKALGYGDTELARTYADRFLAEDQAPARQKALVRMALLPGFSIVANKVLGSVFRRRAKRPMLRTYGLLDKEEALRKFPTLAMFDDPL